MSILNKKSLIAVDTETTSLYPVEAELVGISFCYAPNHACYIPLKHKSKKCLNTDLVLNKIKKILEDKSIKKVGQNIKFDNIILKKYKINLGFIHIGCRN